MIFTNLTVASSFSAESVRYDNRDETLTVEMNNDDIHGNIDGGHTMRAIFQAQEQGTDLDFRYVFAEIFVGITSR